MLSYEIRDKQKQVIPSSRNPDASRLEPLDKSKREGPVLTQPEVEHIANLALQLETLFDAPQDVEWSYEEDELFLLQSRPITTRQAQYPGEEPLVIFKPLVENFTEPLTPLTENLMAQAIPNFAVFYGGHMYVRLDLARKLMPFDLSDGELADVLLMRTQPTAKDLSATGLLRAGGLMALLALLDGANWLARREPPGG